MPSVANSRDLSLTTGLGPKSSGYYKYTPLPTSTAIRVIEWPRVVVPTADLQCKLRIIDLDDPDRPPYYSISYTWGAADGIDAEDAESMESLFTNTIVCEDKLLRVTENAHVALSQLRWRGRACLYWLDAVSINQQDAEERSQQVALMGRIYAESERTMVWLGECDNTTETFYREHVQSFCQVGHVQKRDESHRNIRDQLHRGEGIAEFLALISLPTPLVDVEGVQAFFARNWFQRLWVIQEVVLAKSIWFFCGGFTFYWQELAKLSEVYENRVQLLGWSGSAKRALQGLSTMRLVSFLRGDRVEFQSLASSAFGSQIGVEEYCSSLLTLIQAFAPSSTTDDRDRVYAPLALASQICKSAPELQFTPNYEKTVETTFYDVAVFILRQMPTLSFLSLCKPAHINQPRTLPSWVPDLRARSAQKPISWLTNCNATVGWGSPSIPSKLSTINVAHYGPLIHWLTKRRSRT